MPDSWKLLIYLVGVVVFFTALLGATNSHAADPMTFLRLDLATVERGYTVVSPDNNFLLPITPKFFQRPVVVKIENIISGTKLPDSLAAISNKYIYHLEKDYVGVLKSPVSLLFKLENNFNPQAKVYFYDKNQEQWRELPSKINNDKKMIVAQTIFPCLEVVVAVPSVTKSEMALIEQPKITNSINDDLTAVSAIVSDRQGNIIFEKNIDSVRPIASLTKLITAEVFLQNNPGWAKRVAIVESDNVGGASVNFEPGDLVTVRDLYFATLTGSKNNATRALMRSTGLSESEFVFAMNSLVKSWGLTNTYFVEPTGLSEKNVSTAREMIEISRRSLSKYDFLEPTTIKWYEVKFLRQGQWKSYWVRNTNMKLLESELYVTGGKTGYTDEAGYNLVTKARASRDSQSELLALVMGAKMTMNYEEVYRLLKKYL